MGMVKNWHMQAIEHLNTKMPNAKEEAKNQVRSYLHYMVEHMDSATLATMESIELVPLEDGEIGLMLKSTHERLNMRFTGGDQVFMNDVDDPFLNEGEDPIVKEWEVKQRSKILDLPSTICETAKNRVCEYVTRLCKTLPPDQIALIDFDLLPLPEGELKIIVHTSTNHFDAVLTKDDNIKMSDFKPGPCPKSD